MAVPGAFAVSTISERIKLIPDAIINKSTLLRKMKEKGRISYNKGGSDLKFPVRSSASNIGGSTSTWGTGGGRTSNPFTEMSLNWRQYKWLPTINDFQTELNENAGQMAKVFDMAAQQLNEVRQDATSRFETHMYGDGSTLSTGDEAGTTPIDGLESIVDDDNSYGGITRSSSNAYWQAQVVSVTNPIQDDNSNDLTNLYEGMMQCYNACSKGKGAAGNKVADDVTGDFDSPETVVTTDTLFRTYWASLEPRQRYSSAQAGPIMKLMFGTAEVEWDQYCTASRVYFLNTNHLHFWCAGSQLITQKKIIEKEAPVSKVYVLTAQCQFFTTNGRYCGAVRTTGT